MNIVKEERVKQGMCTLCGIRPAREGLRTCEFCAERYKKKRIEDRAWCKEHGYCPVCQKNKLFGAEKICIECKAKHNEFNHKYYQEHKDKMQAQSRKNNRTLYQKRKEQGLCTKCGSKFLKPGRSKCYLCLAKDQDIARRYRDRLNGGVVVNG